MSKIKVCILQNGLSRGGTDTFVVNLCRGLDKSKYNITVVNPRKEPNGIQREPEVVKTGANIVHSNPLSGVRSIIKQLISRFRLLKEEKFDVFQTNIDLFNGPNLFIAWLARVPIRCCHSHNTMQQKSLTHGMTPGIRIYQSVMKWMCWTFSNRRSGCSEDAMNFLFAGREWHQNKYPIVINNGIDIDSFRLPIDIDKKKRELNLKAKFHIITVGRIIPQKNPLFIAQSFCELCKLRNDVDLVWIGVGDRMDECKTLLQRIGFDNRVHFLGSRTDVNEILPCCNLFYMPSVFEGLGIVIIEAQAAGLQCLVSDVVPMEANCGGVIYKSLNDDVKSWALTLSDMLDKKYELSLDETKIQEFSIAHMVQQMEKVFEK